MYVIKEVGTGRYVKHIKGTLSNFKVVDNINDAQHFSALEWANEVSFWHLPHTEDWVIVDRDTGKEYSKKLGKYHP